MRNQPVSHFFFTAASYYYVSISREILLKAKRIAVVRTDRLGDMVLTLPMCAALKQECPEAAIILITRSYVAPLLFCCSALDETVFADTEDAVSSAIRTGNFDIIFFPRPQFSEYRAAFRARIPMRVGSGYRWYSFLLTHKQYDHRKTAEYHEAEYNTRLIEGVLGHNVPTRLVRPCLEPESRDRIQNLFDSHGLAYSTPIIIHPGSGASAVDWPVEKFGDLACELLASTSHPIVLTGISSERHLCDSITMKCPQAVNLCGELPLSDMIALLDRAVLLIANSTGVLHVAAALGTPVVGLYPQTVPMSAARWGPYTNRAIVLTPPPGNTINDDMSMITQKEVAAAALLLIDRSNQMM